MAGRPTVVTEEVIAKLEEGFVRGLSDVECCLYSDIAPSTLYEYCKANPEFAERKDELKNAVKMRAKLNIADGITLNKDLSLSQWYLERKAKDEFSGRQELTGKDGSQLFKPSPEEQILINRALSDE